MNPGLQHHRSLTFWAGLIVILFTCWAWRDTATHISSIEWKQVWTANSVRGLYFLRTPLWKADLLFKRYPRPPFLDQNELDPFQPPFLARWKPEEIAETEPEPETSQTPGTQLRHQDMELIHALGPGSWSLYIPYWIIVPLLTLTWILLLFLRARRRRAHLLQIP